jgi:hypothetical protein
MALCLVGEASWGVRVAFIVQSSNTTNGVIQGNAERFAPADRPREGRLVEDLRFFPREAAAERVVGRLRSLALSVLRRGTPMPNGGIDNCGVCGFNRANEGVWGRDDYTADERLDSAYCTIRQRKGTQFES